VLVLHRVDIRRDRSTVIRHASLKCDSPGLVFVVGSGGAGKSTLLAALSGRVPGVSLAGMADLDGEPVCRSPDSTAWLPQHAELRADLPAVAQIAEAYGLDPDQSHRMAELAGFNPENARDRAAGELPRSKRRLLARLAALCHGARLYLADEPTADLDEPDADLMRRHLGDLATRAPVIVATHNRRDCLALGGRTALLAGGTVQECTDTVQFFVSPTTAAGRTYVQTGSCSLPCVHTCRKPGDGIWWVIPGLLCGMSRPGLVLSADQQFRQLAQCGVRMLICMEERCPLTVGALRAHSIELGHVPVQDMTPPSFAQAVDLCRRTEPMIRRNEGVAVHCRGGLGRTGTALAAILIWFGDAADQAIDRVRAAQPLAIQTVAQIRFLHDFADRIRGWH
jgi:atypical dual specificity phosphatase